ncbi:MAG: hypothetical protein U1F76_02770 [Candidatus Competibacteraceae bacterium]
MDKNTKCTIILEQLLQAAVEAARTAATESGEFAEGKRFAYYDILSIAKEMAEIEEIETSEIGMLDFDPDKELLNAPGEVTTAI